MSIAKSESIKEDCMAQNISKPKRILFWILLLACIGYGLEHVPGSYTIEDFQDEYELSSPEGIALLALSDVSLDSELYFEESARHRISRNAEIVVPAGTTLQASATMVPVILNGKVVAGPNELLLTSNKPLTFIYRFVTVAKAKTLKIYPDDPEKKVKAIGHYKLLTALATGYRYKRQKEVRKEYEIPKRASLNFRANVLPNHQIITDEGYSIVTGSKPGALLVEGATWSENRWQQGSISLSLSFSDINPLVDQLVTDLLPDSFELGDLFKLKVKQVYDLQVTQNHLTLYVKGSLTSANSKRMANIFNPSFQTHLGIQFTLPKERPISEAQVGIELKNIYSLDINRSNPVFDKMVRDVIRTYRDDAKVTWGLGKEFPILNELPGTFFVQSIELNGNEKGFPTLEALIEIQPAQ